MTDYKFTERSTEITKVIAVEAGVIVEGEYGDRYEVEALVYVQPDGATYFNYSHATGRYVFQQARAAEPVRIPGSEDFNFTVTPAWAGKS
jgi:hypothetical protein